MRTLAILLVALAIPLTYSTMKGYTSWWFPSSGSVIVDGLQGGFVHRNSSGSAAIVTLTDVHPNQSYLVGPWGSPHVVHCGGWQTSRFSILAIGDVNPPCMGFLDDNEIIHFDLPLSRTLSLRKGHAEFTTRSGKRVAASW
jgi:hypothetical protein